MQMVVIPMAVSSIVAIMPPWITPLGLRSQS